MKSIVFIGTQKSGSSREAIKAAERLGYYTILFTDRVSFLEKRTEFPDVHFMQLCDLSNIEEIRNLIRRLVLKALEIRAIVSFVDPHCYTACLLAEDFGVNRFSQEAIRKMQDKILSREALSKTSYCPRFMTLNQDSVISDSEIENILPVIMKSPNSAGSKDVFRIDTCEDFRSCMSRLFDKYPGVPILVEEYLDGPQYLVETIVHNSKINIIAIFQQEIVFQNCFLVMGYNLMTNPEKDFYEKLKAAVTEIIECHGMEAGPCHLEMRYINDQWKLIEVNPRISGGGMNKLLEAGLGMSLVEETLKFALGQSFNIQPPCTVPVFAQYLISSDTGILEKVTGRNRASRCPGVRDIYIKPRKGALLAPPTSMGSRYAYVIATGSSEEEAKANAQYAASQIRFWLLPYEPCLKSSHRIPEPDSQEY